MLIEEIHKIFKINAIKCGSHKRILKDLEMFDEEMDLDNLKQIDFLEKGIDLLFELSYENDLLISLPQFYPFKSPEFYVIDNNNDKNKTQIKQFVYETMKKDDNFNKEDIENYFTKLNELMIMRKPTVKLYQLIDEVMSILQVINIGWYVE